MEADRLGVPADQHAQGCESRRFHAVLQINDDISLPERDLSYRMSRSSGPGGQNVNKVETRVTVLFDLARSRALNSEQKARIRENLATRIDKQDRIRVLSQRHRTQAANRNAARARLAELLREALAEKVPRKPTRKPASADRRRLEDKRRRSDLKRLRRSPLD